MVFAHFLCINHFLLLALLIDVKSENRITIDTQKYLQINHNSV